jgi:hypothetical protein
MGKNKGGILQLLVRALVRSQNLIRRDGTEELKFRSDCLVDYLLSYQSTIKWVGTLPLAV